MEIEARSSLGKRRLLARFAVATEPVRVFDVVPLIMPVRADAVPPSDGAMALELLETLTRDAALKHSLAVFEAAPLNIFAHLLPSRRSIRGRVWPVPHLTRSRLITALPSFSSIPTAFAQLVSLFVEQTIKFLAGSSHFLIECR